jgi:haloalkane dehalogenase
MAVCRHDRMTPAVRAGYLAPYGSWADRIAILRFVQDIPLKEGHPSYRALEELERQLPSLREFPMLFIWGMRDWCFTPAFLEEFQKRFPHAETLRIAEAGHYVFEDAHEQIVSKLQTFLAQYPVGSRR